MQQVLAWAMDHDTAVALRLGVALAPWWLLRGRTAGGYPLLRDAADRAAPRGDTWCAAQFWLGQMAWSSADLAKVLGHYTAVCEAIGDRGPSRALADCLAGRSLALANQCRAAEAAADARRSLAVARELRYPAGEAEALMILGIAAANADDLEDAVRLARQALQIPADVPSWRAQSWSAMATQLLMDAGNLAEAERSCLAGLARAEAVGDVDNGPWLLIMMAHLDVQADRADVAAARLHEAFRIASRTSDQTTLYNALECAGSWCAATGRSGEASRYGPP
jgi:tetratricopeptide (TPR) repeat protein